VPDLVIDFSGIGDRVGDFGTDARAERALDSLLRKSCAGRSGLLRKFCAISS